MTVQSAKQRAVPHPPLPVDGNGTFSNYHLAALVLGAPILFIKFTPFISFGFWTYVLYVLITGAPITVAYWTIMSTYGPRRDEKVPLPNKPQSNYITIKDPHLRQLYHDKKIPMQVFHDAYFDSKIDFNGVWCERLAKQSPAYSAGIIKGMPLKPWSTGTIGLHSTSRLNYSNLS